MSLVIVGMLLVFVQTVDISRRVNYEYAGMNLAKKRLEDVRVVIRTNGFDALGDFVESTERKINRNGMPDQDGEFARTTAVTTPYSESMLLASVEVNIYYYYRGERTTAPIKMTTVFSRLE